ncbi:putative trichothecene 3-O-acetyltransferase [Xylaria sp. FL0933]|nr:putative trichothecene 3-O-acetyltransferase [Xylaria sp. FL0933]
MSESDAKATKPELDHLIDVFGQRIIPVFTQISFCFDLPDGDHLEDILTTLKQGSERLAKHFPWLAGQVVCENATDTSTGYFKIKPLKAAPRVWIKDLRDDLSMPSWEVLKSANFPMRSLSENIVAPRQTIDEPNESVAEVFQLQATIFRGGLILTFLGHHQAMDGTCQAQIIHWFSKCCRDEGFTPEQLRIGNFAPEDSVDLLGDSWTPGPELDYNIIKQDSSQPGPGRFQGEISMEAGSWSHYNFSASSLERLKSRATETLPQGASYITTDDALTAFVWQSIARARFPRFGHSTNMVCARAVDLRRYLGIPEMHPGCVQNMTYHPLNIVEAAGSPLGILAADLRAALDPRTSNLTYHVRSLTTLISRTLDKKTISFLAGHDPSRDVMLSSWANQNSYQLDFGLELGNPRAMRRPLFDSLPGLAYILPRTLEGHVGVVICLSLDDTQRLREDRDFMKSVTCID